MQTDNCKCRIQDAASASPPVSRVGDIMMEPLAQKERAFLGQLALVLFAVGILGSTMIFALRAPDDLAMIFLVVSELLALVFGTFGRKSLTGKLALGGVLILAIWSSITYICYLNVRAHAEQSFHDVLNQARDKRGHP